jgi:indole-3-glycerol phosphate synthase
VQAAAWRPPGGVLGRLTAEAHARAAELPSEGAMLAEALRAPKRPSMASALRRGGAVAVIAEVKRRSPSKGEINAGLSTADTARDYAAGGALALSILTEPNSFGGSLADLAEAAGAVEQPLLRKDFIVDPRQVLEARTHGASAVLLIARALSPDALPLLAATAAEAGLDFLVEIRDESELERALAIDAMLIGVNSRDLETLRIDQATGARLIPLVPPDRVAIAESGIGARGDVVEAARWGADAVLVGSSISAAANREIAVRQLCGVPRERRGG